LTRGGRSPVSGFPFWAGKRGTRARRPGRGQGPESGAGGRQGPGPAGVGKTKVSEVPKCRLICLEEVATLYLVEGADARREAR